MDPLRVRPSVGAEWWYHTEEFSFVCSPRVVIPYYTRLFREPHASLTVYDDATVDQGLWFALSQCQLGAWLWDTKLPVRPRRECVAAMPTMFREFFVARPLENSACWMWWDLLRTFHADPDLRIVEAMVRALEEVLRLPARHCRMSALHGLGHVRLDRRISGPRYSAAAEGIIRAFLETVADLDDELVAYAERALAGTMQ